MPAIADVNALLTKNRIFIERTMGVGAITPKEAIARGFTGPCLRAAGVPLDLRKDETYLVYDRFDFDVPVGEEGDTCDRYMVRIVITSYSIHYTKLYDLTNSLRVSHSLLPVRAAA